MKKEPAQHTDQNQQEPSTRTPHGQQRSGSSLSRQDAQSRADNAQAECIQKTPPAAQPENPQPRRGNEDPPEYEMHEGQGAQGEDAARIIRSETG